MNHFIDRYIGCLLQGTTYDILSGVAHLEKRPLGEQVLIECGLYGRLYVRTGRTLRPRP